MPAPSAPGSTKSTVVVLGLSPREAAQRAIVYRRTRERPRERGLRLLSLLGTLVVHLMVLFGMVLGSAYDLEPSPTPPVEALQVRLIDKPEPPPPPPVRGSPPKQRGPLHRAKVSATRATATTAAHNAIPAAKSPQPPVRAAGRSPPSITPAPAAAPPQPASLPQPQPSPTLAPVPLSGEPPQITLASRPTAKLEPPTFQPEPVRKPQLEGNRPLLPPPSLAMPELPAQSPPTIAPPSIALDRQPPVSSAPPASMPLARPLPAPPSPPAMEPVPLPAAQAPTINLQSAAITPSPSVPREQPRVQVAAVTLDQPELAAIPSTDQPAPIQPVAPTAPALDTRAITPPPIQPTLARPQPGAPELPSVEAAAKARAPVDATPANPAPASAAATPADATADNAPSNPSSATDVSTAPNASPQGSDTATPGQPNGTSNAAADQTSPSSTSAPPQGTGTGTQGLGKSGTRQPGAEQGQAQGKLGSYVQLRPRGDTTIMSHGTPDIGYKPTRFAQAWTPEGESSIDTALRHAVEKTTVKHVFHLPRGVRVGCSVSPLLPIALFSCGSADPPPKLVAEKVYERLDLAPVKPLAAPVPAPAHAATTPTPIQLDNSAACAAARLSGGPLPPDCATPATDHIALPALRAPASTASSWVPASDQFH